MAEITNPVLPGFNPDPSIVRTGDDYYIAVSSFEWFPGVPIYHSRDLVHWRLLTHALSRRSQLNLLGDPCSGGVWAPCLSFHDELFYLCYTDVKNRSAGFIDSHNYLITAPAITGPWSEPVYLNSSGFDPSMFHDDDGRKWFLNMVWDWINQRNRSGGIVLQEYSTERRRLIGEPRLIFRGTALGGTEAPHLYRRGGWYYLMTAEGGTGYGHAVTMARSQRIDGPYALDPANPVLTSREDSSWPLQKAGHASLVQTQAGDWYLAHLCGRPLDANRNCNLGRETAIQKVYWDNDGWLRLVGQGCLPQLKVPAPDLPPHPFPADSEVDNFDQAVFSPHWQALRREPDAEWLSLTARPGFLRLLGGESPSSTCAQSLIARRLTSFRAEAATRVEFKPTSFQQMAGLICIYNRLNFMYLNIGCDRQGGRVLRLLFWDRGVPQELADAEVPVREHHLFDLRVRLDHQVVRFEYSLDQGRNWQRIGPDLAAGLLSDDHCDGFTGTMIGLCAQDMSGRRHPADFDFFKYRTF